jgi:cytochrome b6-f complex subunit 5
MDILDNFSITHFVLVITYNKIIRKKMIEPLLFGLVLGFVPVTLAGLFVAAYLQYRRGNQFGL